MDELRVFIWKNSKPQAMQGYNDDLVMSFSTAYYDAIVRKNPPASLKEVPTTFPVEPKKADADKKKEAKP